MKIEKHHTIGFFDVDHAYRLRVQSVARFFQEMATLHSTTIGAGHKVLKKKNQTWFLHRLEIEFSRYPLLDETIQITTWSRGFKGYKGFREYRIHSAQGEIARGSGVWLFFDMKKKRISKVPAQISSRYEIEAEKGFDRDINDWNACGKIEPEHEQTISLRYSDFDMNGHVNNTKYLGFLETLYHQTINTDGPPIKNIKIRFCREIDRTRQSIQLGWHRMNGVYQCNLFDASTLYADAEIIPMD